ncbi:MAG: lauroyl acyltransferase [Cereibacter sphaeroides]|uniref:Lauroyl acyltransferase n=1 Tax=Cereibacter sphaeroides TaxID=1063 RepID=A0A2W5SCJ9_CERSP|nr:MAG: lauroyl acyltransferase [Cereibacter sphaeroides]
MDDRPAFELGPWLQDRALRFLIGTLLCLPYTKRVPLCGWLMARVIGPLAGYDARVRDNLARIMPDLPKAEVDRLVRAVPDNVGRTVIEMYSGEKFIKRATRYPLEGAGLEQLAEATAAKRPIIVVSGHFGNYDAGRAALIKRGYPFGGLYRPMKNRYFNEHYVAAISKLGLPLFPRSKQGLGDMIRFLRKGGILGLLIDQHISHGARLSFFGHDAMTALSAADMAIRYDALVFPIYAIRLENGLDFRIIVEAPIPRDTPEVMTQALNDSLEALVRKYPDQWLWIHRRWKVGAAS